MEKTSDFSDLPQANSSQLGESDKKRNRIDSFATALANRSRGNAGGGGNEQQFPMESDSKITSAGWEKPVEECPICGLSVPNQNDTMALTRKCSNCQRIFHVNCDIEVETHGAYNCSYCRKGQLLRPLIASGSGNLSDEEIEELVIRTTQKYDDDLNQIATSNNQLFNSEHNANLLEQESLIGSYSNDSTPRNPTPTTASNNSIQESQTPTPQPEGAGSDNDEYQPPGSLRKSDTTRVGRGKGKKPISTSTEISRQTTMKTRSGGKKPTVTSYVAKYSTFHLSDTDEKFTSRKGRGKGSKSTGRGRRSGGRGGKLISMYTAPITNSRRESGQGEASEDRKNSIPEKKDYIRTAVVTSASDKFLTEYPYLCLICGSIGKDKEGIMISCMTCAQSFHTYCVSMHDKLNNTLIKRGWRCLDCTVCECCGNGEDESNLLLCDECDISCHIYCLTPPLECIPQGPWRCKWCSTCIRCNNQVKSGIELRQTEGYCETCYSLRKCPKCTHFYEIGDLILKCQHCLRWFHGRCEGHSTEEQAENAAENAFRCSFCRPQTFNDVFNMPVVVDNVMVSKSLVEQIHGMHNNHYRPLTLFGADHYGIISRSISSDQDELDDDIRDQFVPNLFSQRGRGGITRGGGPGRRVLKLGVGGFTVRNPKNRTMYLPQNVSNDDETQITGNDEDGNVNLGPIVKPKIRRPRKLRRPLLEDSYPTNMQESFFGVPAVDSRMLAEQSVDEPSLVEYKKSYSIIEGLKFNSELSEHSAELLRNEQEMDMLGDFPLVEDIGLDIMDMENLDFTDLIVGEEEEEVPMENVDSVDGEFNAASTSSLAANTAPDICSPSSSIRVSSRANEPINPTGVILTQKKPSEANKPIEQQRLSAAAKAAELWEEDEPLGDKATKAAVLYANVHHPQLKEKFPIWSDRVRQISKVWRELNSEKRQEFVEWARKNRVNCPTQRRRARRTNSFGNPLQQTGSGMNQQNEFNQASTSTCMQSSNIAQPSISMNTTQQLNSYRDNDNQQNKREIPQRGTEPTPSPMSRIISQQSLSTSSSLQTEVILKEAHESQQMAQFLEIKKSLQIEEEKIEQMKKIKRSFAAKQRQLSKQIELTTIPEEAQRKGNELKDVEMNLNSAKKAIQGQQKIVDKCRQRLKEHVAPKPQAYQQIINKFTDPSQPSTSSQIITSTIQQSYDDNYLLSSLNVNDSCQTTQGLNFDKQQNFNVNDQYGANNLCNLSKIQPMKGTRGRKRKKPLPEQLRTPRLGGIWFSTLTEQQDKDIYDVVDKLVNIVEMKKDEKGADAQFVRRILLSQQQQDQEQCYSMQMKGMELSKEKKKRQTQAKCRNQPDMTTEFDILQQRIKESLSHLSPLVNSLEQYQTSDKQMLKYPNQTDLSDRNRNEMNNQTKNIGQFSLPFMPDFYEELESCREGFIDEESLFPPTMCEICMTVDLDALESNELEEKIKIDAFKGDGKCELADNEDFPFLSIDSLANRTKLVKSNLLLGITGPDIEVPIDPHWSRFEEDQTNLDREVEVIIDIDPSKINREELMESLQNLLGIPDLNYMEIETPPQTPAPLISKAGNGVQIQQKIESPENGETNFKSTALTKACKTCNKYLRFDEQIFGEFPNNLEVHDESQKPIFCSLSCYFKYLATCRVPLTVELLEKAEQCVDEETFGILREISVENFTKRINAGQTLNSGNFDILSSISIPLSACTIENAHLPREFHIRSAELSTVIQNSGIGQEKKTGSNYKWRGHGWVKCDLDLINSFQLQQNEIKQTPKSVASMVQVQMDNRSCSFCGEIGDGEPELTGRLLNVDANEWVHVNCCWWSSEIHCTDEGALMHVERALRKAQTVECKICGRTGASIRCYKLDCVNKDFAFHLPCAKRSNGQFVKDKTFYCANHEIRQDALINQLSALRRLYIYRDENQLLSKIFNHSSSTEMIMRAGTLIFQKIGQLLPEQLRNFTTTDYIFPIGYKITRIFWSITSLDERMRYECSIAEKDGVPDFKVNIVEIGREFKGTKPTLAWTQILKTISTMRDKSTMEVLRFFPSQISGEVLFGFAESSISKILESLPGIDQLYTYTFKHGGTPLMDVPLAENPSGCARCEPCFRTLVKRKHRPIISNSPKKNDEKIYASEEAVISREGRVRTASFRNFPAFSSSKIDHEMLKAYKASGISERMLQAPYLRNNEAALLIAQYKEMKKEWRENVYLARSRIQGLGLYAKKDLDMNQMIIEYIGEMIRNEVCEIRQKRYSEQNRGEYMFRIDGDWVVDATMAGGPARYVNHSCDPNCGTKILTINDEKKIVIYANRPIRAGEELTYDYQFEIEEAAKKIACLCNAPNCARWMN